eukprot:UC1_evm6s1007
MCFDALQSSPHLIKDYEVIVRLSVPFAQDLIVKHVPVLTHTTESVVNAGGVAGNTTASVSGDVSAATGTNSSTADGTKASTQGVGTGAAAAGRVRKVFLGGLPPDTTENNIVEFFGQFGGIEEVLLQYDRETQRLRGFGFLTFVSPESVDAVCRQHFFQFRGKKIEVKRAQSKADIDKRYVPGDGLPGVGGAGHRGGRGYSGRGRGYGGRGRGRGRGRSAGSAVGFGRGGGLGFYSGPHGSGAGDIVPQTTTSGAYQQMPYGYMIMPVFPGHQGTIQGNELNALQSGAYFPPGQQEQQPYLINSNSQ